MIPSYGPIASIVASAVSLIFCILEGNTFLGIISVEACVASALLLILSLKWKVNNIVCVASSVVMFCVICQMLYLLHLDVNSSTNEYLAYHFLGLLLWGVTFPVGYILLSVIAIAFEGSYNRILIGSFSGFISMQILSLQWIMMSIFFETEIETQCPFAMELSYLFVNFLLSVLASIIIAKALKGKGIKLEREIRGGI